MSGLCGWIGEHAAVGEPASALDAMLGRLPAHRPGDARSFERPDRALGLRVEPATASWHVAGETAVAVEGYPAWDDTDLAAEAGARGHAAALATGFRRHGVGVLDRLKGAFALAVVDGTAKRALIAVDRMGIHPMCFARLGGDAVVFGSTTDAVRAHPAVSATVRPQAIYDYFYFLDRIPAPETIYEEQRKLPPGHYLLFDDGVLTVAHYWRMPYGGEGGGPKDELAAALLDHLRRAVGASLSGEDPSRVGTFLSGGLDSTTVLGLLADVSPRPKAFTIGFAVEGFDETPYAEVSARHFGADHDVYYVAPDDVVEVLPRIAEAYDEPFGNSSAVPAYYCARRAREAGIDTLLAGDGGDELFAGNSRYLEDEVFERYRSIPAWLRMGAIEPLAAVLGPLDGIPIVRKARRYVALAHTPVAQRLYRDNLFGHVAPDEVFDADFLAAVAPQAPAAFACGLYDGTGSAAKLHRMMNLDLHLVLADGDLRKVSRMCELAGVRVRFPFLDDALVAFSGKIPPDLLMEGGALRAFYKKALSGLLPRETMAKAKKGFGLPFLHLLEGHGPLREMAHDNARALDRRGIFHRAFVARVLDGLGEDEFQRYGYVVWDLMMLNLWFDAHT